MLPETESALLARLARLEAAVADVSRRLDEHVAASSAGAKAGPPRKPAPRVSVHLPRSVESRGADWWLARGGALLTLFALVLLYQYAVDRNWITPLLRIVFGTVVGAALMVAANRTARPPETAPDDSVGLREVLMGAALAAWYVTAYAAAVFYGLISMSAARLVFLGLSIAGASLALRERRAVLSLLALGAGFAAPVLLPSPAPAIPQFALFAGALCAIGLMLYLMRGWQSVLWLTFVAFWWSTAAATGVACCSAAGSGLNAQISMSLLLAIAAVAMTRVPLLRRRLLALGSPLYTESIRSAAGTSVLTELARKLSGITGQAGAVDSPAVWIITLASPLIAIAQLSLVWPRQSSVAWAALAFGAAALAWRLASSPRAPDEEFTHVEAAAVAVWSLAGSLWLAAAMPERGGASHAAGLILAASVHALVALEYTRNSRFLVPARLARATTLAVLFAILAGESNLRAVEPYWSLAALAGIGVALRAAWMQRNAGSGRYAAVAAGGAYVALMLVDARVLGSVFRPLVTASYAIAGTALLIAGRTAEHGRWIRRVGGLTLVLVVARLLIVDMADVETIWRVLLFLGIGTLFLVTSNRMQRTVSPAPGATEPVK